jgi:hypothetical protein
MVAEWERRKGRGCPRSDEEDAKSDIPLSSKLFLLTLFLLSRSSSANGSVGRFVSV